MYKSKVIFSLLLVFFSGIGIAFSQSQTFDTAGSSGSFIVPAGVTSLDITLIGGGGGGAYGTGAAGGGGGQGETAVITSLVVSPSQVILYEVGTGGSAGIIGVVNGGSGTSSSFGATYASFGFGGTASNGGAGGSDGTTGGNITYTAGINGQNSGEGGGTGNGAGGNGGTDADGSAGNPGKITVSWTCPSLNSNSLTYPATSSLFCTSETTLILPSIDGTEGTTGGVFGSSPGLDIDVNTGEIDPSNSTAFTYKVSYTILADRGCPQISDTVEVIINPLPIVTLDVNTSVCQGDTLFLSGPDGMSNYLWQGPQGFYSSVQKDTLINISTNQTGFYKLGITDANSCYNIDSIEVTVNTLPIPTTGSYAPLCVGDTLFLAGGPDGLNSYLWEGPLNHTSATQKDTIFGIEANQAGYYKFTATNSNACSATDSVLITVNELPNIIISNDTVVCKASTIKLTSEPGGLSSYSWAGPNSFSENGQNQTILNADFIHSGTYTVTITDLNGCISTAETEVGVRPTKMYVNANVSGGLNDGTSWSNAFSDLQSALGSSSCVPDTVWVAGGVYFPSKDPSGNLSPSDPRDKTFIVASDRKIYGGFAGTETLLSQRTSTVIAAHPSVLNGNLNGSFNTNDDAYHVVLTVNSNDNTLLDGFTFTNGNATGTGNLTVDTESISRRKGAAIYAVSSSIHLVNCKFEINNAYTGGAIYNEDASIDINNCLFQNNSATSGGAMYNLRSSPTIVNSGFYSNRANLGGAVYSYDNSLPDFRNTSFTTNVANLNGGALLNELNSNASIRTCTFSSNSAINFGGAINNTNRSSTTIDKSTFSANNANYGGGVYNISKSNVLIDSCNFFNNTAPNKGGGVYNEDSSQVEISYSLFSSNYSNSGGAVYNLGIPSSLAPLITHCSFINNTGGYGGALANFNASPIFKNLILDGNSSTYNGGGMYNSNGSKPTVLNCTFYRNSSAKGGGMYNSSASWPIIKNVVFWENKSGNNASAFGADIENSLFTQTKASVEHSLLQLSYNQTNYPKNGTIEGYQGNTNSNFHAVNPQFINIADPDGADDIYGTLDDGLQLKNCSPAVNTGDNSVVSATDIAGQTRVMNAILDLGAFENQTSKITVSLAVDIPTPFCQGTELTFEATPLVTLTTPYTYSFLVNGKAVQTSTSTTFSIDTLKNSDQVRVLLTNASCDSSGYSSPIDVVVYDLPKPNTVGDTVCSGFPVQLFASNQNLNTGNSYKWTGPGITTDTTVTVDSVFLINAVTTAFSGKYFVEITDVNSCKMIDATNVLVRPLPTVTLSGGGTICNGEALPNVVFNITGTSPYTVRFDDGTDNDSLKNISTNLYTYTNAPAGNYTLVAANDKYCSSTVLELTGTADVIVNPIPPIAIIDVPPIKSVCFGETLSLEVNNCTGTITWLNNSVAVSAVSNPLILDTVGIYSVSAYCTELGCVSDTSDIVNDLEIKIKPAKPNLNLNSASDLCSPGLLSISGTCAQGLIIWTNSDTVLNEFIGDASLSFTQIGAYSISALCSFNNCISVAADTVFAEIKIKPTVPTVTIPTNAIVCEPDSLVFDAVCASGTINWLINDVNTANGTVHLVFKTPDSYTVKSFCALNGCFSDTLSSGSFTIKEKPSTPILTSPAILEICEPDSVVIYGSCTAGSSILWMDNSLLDSIVLKTVVDNYDVYATCTKEGCASDTSLHNLVTVKAAPIPVITSNSPICQGETLTLSSSQIAANYTWFSPTAAVGSDTISIKVPDAEAGIYTLNVTYANGCSASDTAIVSFNTILTEPVVTLPGQLTICAPNSLTFSATCNAGNVLWFKKYGTELDSIIAPSLTLSTANQYEISARCISNACYSNSSDTTSVEIKPTTDFTVGSNSPICSGAILTLTSSLAGETYSWQGPNGFTNTNQIPGTVPSVAGNYALTLTYTNGCTLTKTTQVVVKSKPSSPNVVVPATLTVCEPTSISFSATCPAGTLKWMNNASSPILKLETPGEYDVKANCTINGCTSNDGPNSTGVKAIIKAKPAMPIITPPVNATVCSPDSLITSGLCVNGSNIKWLYDNSTNGSLKLKLANTYSISAICSKESCNSDASTSLAMEIISTPATPTVTGPTNSSVCSPSNLQISASCATGTVLWSTGATGNSLTLTAVQTYSISARCNLNGCLSAPSEIKSLEIKAVPSVLASNNGPLCAGATLNLSSTSGSSYVWAGPNGFNNTMQNPVISNTTINRTGNYSVTVIFPNGCSANASTSVIINASPIINISANPSTVESGSSATLTLNGCSGGLVNWSINNSSTNPLTLALFNTSTFTAACTINGCTSVTSKVITVSNPCESLLKLNSTTDDYNTGTLIKQASAGDGKIEAKNAITGNARVNYEAKSIELKEGFKTEPGVVFTAQVGGCN
jgi:hypothetical protein